MKGIGTDRVTSFSFMEHGHQETKFYYSLHYVFSPNQMSLQLELFQPNIFTNRRQEYIKD